MARVLLISLALHVAIAAALARLHAPAAHPRPPIEITIDVPAPARRADAMKATDSALPARADDAAPASRSRAPDATILTTPRAANPSGAAQPATSSQRSAPRPKESRTQPANRSAASSPTPMRTRDTRSMSAAESPAARDANVPSAADSLAARDANITSAVDSPRARAVNIAPANQRDSAQSSASSTSFEHATSAARPAADGLHAATAATRANAANEPATHSPSQVDLFAATALARSIVVDNERAPKPVERAWRPRRGVGGEGASGGVDVASFLAEDAARQRVAKGAVAPELRALERRLDGAFVPTFVQADVSDRAALFIKQMRGFWRHPPKTGELQRGIDPAQETYQDKLRSMHPERAFFLGRQVEVFVRQHADGSIAEIALRNASGYRAFDDAAVAAVTAALGGHLPAGANDHGGDVRTLWQLEATAYVVVSPNPELVFDESSGKQEWIYPLQKKVDHHVRLMALY